MGRRIIRHNAAALHAVAGWRTAISMNDDVHRQRAGMTLLELVVALVVAGLALASGYQAYATISDRRLVAVTRSDQVTRAFNLRTMIANWLSNARLTVEEDDVVFRSIDDRKPRDDQARADLVFLTSARTPVSDHGTIVHLFVAHDSGGGRGLMADLAEWRGRRRVLRQLEPSITGMSAESTSSWVSSTVLPASVRLRFSPANSASLEPLLRIPLLVVLDGAGR
jgi:prepilin-type N-terminal cleavage/methylation domain-containing protein